jgi:hypothetical protein
MAKTLLARGPCHRLSPEKLGSQTKSDRYDATIRLSEEGETTQWWCKHMLHIAQTETEPIHYKWRSAFPAAYSF